MELSSGAISPTVSRLRKTIENLLFFLEVPDAETTARVGWLTRMAADIRDDFDAVSIALTDPNEQGRISELRVDATHFANVLHANPGIRLTQWTDDFPDCLSQLRAFVRELERLEVDGSTGDENTETTAHPTAQIGPNSGAPVPKNGSAKKVSRVFDSQCKTLLRRWVKAMEKGNEWIPRMRFFADELPVLQSDSPNTWLASWKTRRFDGKFKLNPDEWKDAVKKWDPKP